MMLSAGYENFAQEICNNSIDDDGNGLIDLHDPACQCQFKVTGNLLLNGSFESYKHCPVYAYDKDSDLIDYWEYGTRTNINETNYYHNFACSHDSELVMQYMPPAFPLPDGNAFVSIMNTTYTDTSIPEKGFTKSYVGQCLQTPLKAGENYALSFYAGRFRSWDNPTGKIFPFTVAVFGNANCKAVPFGKSGVLGNGCPTNYEGWVLLGETEIFSENQWLQNKISFTVPFDIKVIEIGVDCSKLPPVIDLADSTTYLDYHQFYLDDIHLLPAKDFPFKYISVKTSSYCNGYPVLQAPVVRNASYQWYKDSIAIKDATDSIYQVTDTAKTNYYNVLITTDTGCIISEPFLVTPSNLNKLNIPSDTFLCKNVTLKLAPALQGISYTINGVTNSDITINKQGNYFFTATDVFGCKKNFNVTVTESDCEDCEPYVPSAFTPNGDGLNDIFKAKFNCTVTNYKLSVYNRWGKRIFVSDDVNKGWNGEFFQDKTLPGSYIYFIQYKSFGGKPKIIKGVVVLIR